MKKIIWEKINGLFVTQLEGFAEVVSAASRIIFDRTKKFEANFMVIASNIKEVLSLTRGWKEVNTAKNGPYYAG